MELRLNNLKKSFGSKVVLHDCSFVFEKGKIYGLLGRNGAGKTTLFNCLSDEIQPDSGAAMLWDGESEREIMPDEIGYVFSVPVLPDFLTGEEFVRFFMDINRDRIEPGTSAEAYFDLVQIDQEDRKKLIKGYSHGMKNTTLHRLESIVDVRHGPLKNHVGGIIQEPILVHAGKMICDVRVILVRNLIARVFLCEILWCHRLSSSSIAA